MEDRENKAHINARDEQWGATPLICAAFWEHSNIVSYLLRNKANVSGVSSVYGYTALHLASIRGNLENVNNLIKHGAEIDAQTHTGATALLLAVSNKHDDVSKLLLERRASANIQDVRGEWPLYYAVTSGALNIVKLLTSHDSSPAHILKATNNGDTVAHAAVKHGRNTEILIFLLNLSSEYINAERNDKNTPLHLAVWKGKLDMVLVLQQYGASFNKKNSRNETPVDIAIRKGNHDIMMVFGVEDIIPHPAPDTIDFSEVSTINKAMHILKRNFPYIAGLEHVNGGHFHGCHSPFMQIMLIVENDRFFLASTIGMKTGHIEYYDPMGPQDNTLTETVKNQLSSIISNSNDNPKLYIHCVKINHNFSYRNSGLLCLYIAQGILRTGICPTTHLMDEQRVRNDTTAKIKSNNFCVGFQTRNLRYRQRNIFSKNTPPSTGLESNIFEVDLYCICQKPFDAEKMKECVKCKRFVHPSCARSINSPDSSISDCSSVIDSGVYCPDCTLSPYCDRQYLPNSELLQKEKIYDCFVSYSSWDYSFVRNHLCRQLEESNISNAGLRKTYKLMIQDKNMIGGASIPEAIVKAICTSRICITVVSHHYLKGHWTYYEWQQMQLSHKWQSVIIILLDPKDELLESSKVLQSVKTIIQTRFCREWRDNFTIEESEKFWGDIRYFLDLPEKKKKNNLSSLTLNGTAIKPSVIKQKRK